MKKRSQPKALLSRQWQSESTLTVEAAAASEPANASPSPTGVPDPCANAGKAPQSVAWEEKPVGQLPGPLDPDELGRTAWLAGPKLEASPFCDGPAKQWVGRVTTATGQQGQKINPSEFAMTDPKIQAANCGVLQAMWGALVGLMNSAGAPAHVYTPSDVIQAHEDVHKSLATTYTANLANAFRATVDSLSASCRDGNQGINDGITEAKRRFTLDFTREELFNKAHQPEAPFIAAHRRAVRPWLQKIQAEMRRKNCPNIPNMPP